MSEAARAISKSCGMDAVRRELTMDSRTVDRKHSMSNETISDVPCELGCL